MKKNDIILIFSVILISIVSFVFISSSKTPGNTVTIAVNGKIYREANLSKNEKIEIGETNTAIIENGNVYMADATCPDGLCIKQGKISDSSERIICLPNKVVIEVSKKSQIDTVVK